MARIKFDNNNNKFVGKVGGQSVSKTRNGFVMSNIVQPPKTAQPKQSRIRYETTRLSGIYRTLTNTEKQSWHNQAPNYPYTNAVKQTIQRRAFEVFKLLNRNRILISENILKTAPPFTPVVIPAITLTSVSSNNITLSATNTQSGQLYMIFIYQHNTVGASSIQPKQLLLYIATKAEMDQGINLLPHLLKGFPYLDFKRAITVRVSAIVKATGNRDKVGEVATAVINPNGLGLDVFSYYPFINNANDYFNNNNPINNGGVIVNSGIVKGAIKFDGSLNSYLELLSSESLNFIKNNQAQNFCISVWWELHNTKQNVIINKRGAPETNEVASYQLANTPNIRQTLVFTNNVNIKKGTSLFAPLHTHQHYHTIITGNTSGALDIYINGVYHANIYDHPYFTGIKANQSNVYIGKAGWNTINNLIGQVSELFFANNYINASQALAIHQANLNGQTILDIN